MMVFWRGNKKRGKKLKREVEKQYKLKKNIFKKGSVKMND